MPYRAEIETALCAAVEKESALDAAGLIFAHGGVANILRYPAEASEPYIYCTAGPDIRTAAPDPPLSTQWRTPWTPSDSRFDVPYDPSMAEKAGPPGATHDLINFGLDLVVLGIGIGVVVMTGGVGALGVWAGVQILSGGALALNDGARSVSDFANGGAIGRFEDESPHYKAYFTDATAAAIVVQFLDGDGFVDMFRATSVTKVSLQSSTKLFNLFSPLKDWQQAKDALGASKLGLSDALRGEIGPGQRVRLGKLLNAGGRKAKILTIRRVLALKIANDFGASLITIGQASFGGPISDLYESISNFQFSLLFQNNNGEVTFSSYLDDATGDDDVPVAKADRWYPKVGPRPLR